MTDSQNEYSPERRPIASREKAISKRLAARLAAAGVSPNAISTAGMIAGIASGVAFALSPQAPMPWLVAAAVLMQLRLLANMLDGMVAVATDRASPVGELFNEVPDRVSDTAIFIGAGFAAGGDPVAGFLAALAAMFTAYLRAEGKVAGAHQEFCGPMAKPQRMFLLTVATLCAALAPASWQADLPSPFRGGTLALTLWLIAAGSLLTAIRRLVRIARALRGPA
jgi:phosphatidylglycerophosphate synthase